MILFSEQCDNILLCIIDSATLDKEGNIDIGLKFDLSFFWPHLLYTGVTWAIFQMSGKWPISKRLFNSLERL